MKLIVIWIVTLLALYFIVGSILVFLELWNWVDYNQVAAIIGGITSILGLLSFILPGIKTNDLKAIELDALKQLTATAEAIQRQDKELTTKQSDIQKLELQKKELEFLVRKASLSLFFKEQLERYNQRLVELVSENKDISRTIKEIEDLKEKISELDVEIEKNPNADKVLEVIDSARRQRMTIGFQSPIEITIESLVSMIKKI